MNKRAIWLIARHEFIINVRRPRFILFTLSVPLLAALGVLLSVVFGRQAVGVIADQLLPAESAIGLVDESGLFSPIDRDYTASLTLYDSVEAARADLEDDTLTSVYVIPPDFIETGGVRVIRLENNNLYDADRATVESYIRYRIVNAAITDPDAADRALNPIATANAETLSGEADDEGGFNFSSDFLVPYVFALLLTLTIFSSSGYLLGGVAEEKGNRVVEILLSSVDASDLLTGKVIGLGALGILRVLFWIVTVAGVGLLTRGWVGQSFISAIEPSLLVLALIYYLLGYLTYALFLGAGAALGGSIQESQQIGGFLSVIAGAPLYLLAVTISNPNVLIARILSWFPLTAPTTMIVRLPFGTVPPIDIVGSIVICTLFLPLTIWAGSRVFRAGLLNYGGKPTLKQVMRMIIQGG